MRAYRAPTDGDGRPIRSGTRDAAARRRGGGPGTEAPI
jgi:hypothetical protein